MSYPPTLRCRIFGHRRLAYLTIRGPVYYANCPLCGIRVPAGPYGSGRASKRWRAPKARA